MFAPLLTILLWIHGAVGGGPVATLSAQTGQGDGKDFAQLSVTTDTGSGTLYYDISTSCGISPTAAQVKAGTVTGSVVNGSQAVSASGAQTANPSGLSGVTTYCAYYTQTTAGGDATVVATSSFSTGGTLSFSLSETAAFLAAQGGTFHAVAVAVDNIFAACLSPAVNVTYNLSLDYSNIGSAAGQSNVNVFSDSYNTTIRSDLIALPNKNTAQQAIFSSPPVSDPTGLGNSYTFACAQGRAIGHICVITPDSQTLFNSTKTYDTTTGGNCAGVNTCLASVYLHEISEGLGRVWGLGVGADLTIFTAYSAPGVRTTNTSGTHYPSVDAGATNLISPFTYATSGDFGDWTGGTDAFTGNYSGQLNATPSVQDIKEMTKMGWGLQHSCRITAGL